jgi:drug/metabolite transporter (DMT)-like permease
LTAIALALCASLGWGLGDFGAGFATRRLSALVVAAGMQTTGLVMLGIVVAASGAHAPTARQLGWAAGAGVVGVVGLTAFYRALAIGVMGVIGPITGAAAVIPVAYGLARGERPSAIQAAGVVLAVVGIVAVSVEPMPEGRGRRVGTGVGLALVAAVCFGWALVGLGRAAAGGVAWATLTMRITGAPVVVALALATRPGVPSARSVGGLAAIGIADAGATLLYAGAAKSGLLSVVAVLSSLYPVVIVVLARLLLAERIARPQLAGVAVALAGVALISAG